MEEGENQSRWDGPGGYREVFKLALPMMLSFGSWSLMHFIDRVFLSWYDSDALAAALPAGILSFTLGTFFLGMVGYVNTFVAQYSGANRPERVGASVWQGIYFRSPVFCCSLRFPWPRGSSRRSVTSRSFRPTR